MLELLETLRGYYENRIPINIKSLITAVMEVDDPRIDKDGFYIQQALTSYSDSYYLYGLCLRSNHNASYGNLWFYFTENSGSNVYIHQFYNFLNDAPEYNINRTDAVEIDEDSDTSDVESVQTRRVNITKEIGDLLEYNTYTRDVAFERKDK